MSIRSCLIIVPLSLLLGTVPAGASLLGDEVSATLTTPTSAQNFFKLPDVTTDPSVATVDGSVEFTADFSPGAGIITADLDANSLWIFIGHTAGGTLSTGTDFLFGFEGLDWVDFPDGEIVDFVLVEGNGALVATIAFGPHSLFLNIAEHDVPSEGQSWHFEIITEHGGVIPEPATMTLMGLGLAGIALGRKRKA